jgi:hypothetical protein
VNIRKLRFRVKLAFSTVFVAELVLILSSYYAHFSAGTTFLLVAGLTFSGVVLLLLFGFLNLYIGSHPETWEKPREKQ